MKPFSMLFLRTAVSAAALLVASCASLPTVPNQPTPLAAHGQLAVKDRQLVDENGQAVQLRGFSTHKFIGLDWMYAPDYLEELVRDWGASVLRLALYTDPWRRGYISLSPGEVNLDQRRVIETILADAERAGLYVIVDWHILDDGNPQKYQKEALDFFAWLSAAHGTARNLIYEICNEPNGVGVTWEDVIRPYAVEVIAAIRKNDPDGIILVGSSDYSKDVDVVAGHPLEGSNLMYSFHFYAGSHGAVFRDRIEKALATIPIFFTEWGSTDSTGNGRVYPAETRQWIDFADTHGLSWCNWSLSNVAEGSAALPGWFNFESGPFKDNLTESGTLVWDLLHGPGAHPQSSAKVAK